MHFARRLESLKSKYTTLSSTNDVHGPLPKWEVSPTPPLFNELNGEFETQRQGRSWLALNMVFAQLRSGTETTSSIEITVEVVFGSRFLGLDVRVSGAGGNGFCHLQ